MTPTAWWEQFPGRLEWELEYLRLAGYEPRLDEAFKDEHGAIRIDFTVDGQPMWAVFPDEYPWFRPEVVSPEDDLPKHQAPFQKNLCLLPREPQAWDAATDSLAGLLIHQLPKVYETQAQHENAEDTEVHQAEPFTAYYDAWPVGGITVDSEWELGAAQSGTFDCALLKTHIAFDNTQASRFVGVVLRVRDQSGAVIAEAEAPVLQRFDGHIAIAGRWGRFDKPLAVPDAADARRIIGRKHRTLREFQPVAPPSTTLQIELVAAVFPVEATYGGGLTDAWMFVGTFDPPLRRAERRARAANNDPHPSRIQQWIRGLRGGRSDMAVRVPQLAPLRDKTVLAVGVGGIGAPAAIQFAQSGASLRLIDHDYIEPATGVRYPLGYLDAGRAKIAGVGEHIIYNFPFSDLEGQAYRLGAVRTHGGESVVDRLLEFVNKSDLIFDATGDHAIGLYLNDLAAQQDIPYVAATTTLGAWGGRVIAVRPNHGPCFECVRAHMRDQVQTPPTDPADSLFPPEDPDGEIRPVGCADATYTGTVFDSAPISAAGVRAAVSLLCEGADDGYPAIDWNVAVIHLRDEQGRPLAGQAHHHKLEQHPDCGECQRRFG